MNRNYSLALLLLTFLIFSGCQKKADFSEPSSPPNSKKSNIPPQGFFIDNRKVPGVAENDASSQRTSTWNKAPSRSASTDADNGDEPLILGQQLSNPYTVANMQQAVNTLYGGNYPISATHLYVRFKPASVEQFNTLEESEDLELQDYPMDYEVLQDGDYYQDPSQGTEEIQWLYTVVPVGYSFPAGIQYEIIDSLYLPDDNEILEDLAESMAAGAQYSSTREVNSDTVQIQRLDAQVETFNYSGEECPCTVLDQPCPVWPDCGLGGGGGGGTGGNDPRIPRGTIEVQDIRTCNVAVTPPTNVPVRQARIVCKRWFKIERTYTNDQGQFVSAKKFKNKVKISVKMKNHYATIRKIRGIRLWQMLFPVKWRIGVFDEGDMANANKLFQKNNPTGADDPDLAYWAAATTHNSVLEFRDYATQLGIGVPPENLKVLISNWGGDIRGTGATPMFNKCNGTMTEAFAAFFIIKVQALTVAGGLTTFVNVMKDQVDLHISYFPFDADYECRLTSVTLKSIAFHELGHAAHYNRVGCSFWTQYRHAIENELTKLDQRQFWPYGTGFDGQNAPIIAAGEMWGNHCGYTFTDHFYGNAGAFGAFPTGLTAIMQGQDIENEVGGLNCYLNAIERFNPNFNLDVHHWIPQGTIYDLNDNRNDRVFGSLVNDNVAGYTTQQCFQALQADVRSIPAFRDRLLQQNGFNQQFEVNQLFTSYGY